MTERTTVEITIYSKDKCGKCEAAKDKLDKMGYSYTVKELEAAIEPHEGWREDGTINLMAWLVMQGDPKEQLPTIQIDDEYFDYSGAMKRLRRKK